MVTIIPIVDFDLTRVINFLIKRPDILTVENFSESRKNFDESFFFQNLSQRLFDRKMKSFHKV